MKASTRSKGLVAALAGVLVACAAFSPGRLERTAEPAEAALRQNFQSYQVFYRPYSALVFQIAGDRKIVLDDHWQPVNDPAALERAAIFGGTSPVLKIVGANGTVFGYIIFASGDSVGVTILDPQTLRVSYLNQRKGGP